jgi:hypothetical protein
MEMPVEVYNTILAVVAKYPHTGDDSHRKEQMKKVVQTVRSRHGNLWVWKSEHPTLIAPVDQFQPAASKDAIAFVPDDPIIHGHSAMMYIWDLVNGTSRLPNPRGESNLIRRSYIVLVEPKDWLADDLPVLSPPPTNTLEARVKLLENEVIRLENERVDIERVEEMIKERVESLVVQVEISETGNRMLRLNHKHDATVTLYLDGQKLE